MTTNLPIDMNSMMLDQATGAPSPFEGFLTPLDGGEYVKIPRLFITSVMRRLSGAANSILLYFFGQSWAFGDYARKFKLSLDEIMHGRKKADGTRMDEGTGLSESAARKGVRELKKAGYITCDVDESDRGRIVSYYGIRVRQPSEEEKALHKQSVPLTEQRTLDTENSTLARGVKKTPLGYEKNTPEVLKVNPGGVEKTPRTEERTLERNSLKENKRKKESAPTRVLSPFPLLEKRLDYEILRTAPWGIETILQLASKMLAVPDEEAIRASNDEEAIERWYADWYKPAERLYHATISLDPVLAWRRIDNLIRYMMTAGSPSWWQQGRTEQTPTMLRHIANHYNDYGAEMKRHHWSPQEITVYDGPLPYAAGYSGTLPRTGETSVEESPPPAENGEQVESPSPDMAVPPETSARSRFAQWRKNRKAPRIFDGKQAELEERKESA